MFRSVLAVAAGYLASAILIIGITLATVPLFTDVPDPHINWSEAAPTLGATWYLFEFVYTVPIGLLAGYLTALMAGRYELRHAAALAGLIAVMGVGSVIWSAGMKPAAADVLLTALAGLACLTGGLIRSKRAAARA